MSTQSTDRSAWISTKWLWVFLAFCLILWRVSSRVEQYHAYHQSFAFAEHPSHATFFDANERNAAAMASARVHSQVAAHLVDALFPVAPLQPPVVPVQSGQWEPPAALPPLYVDSVSLFSNPPPPLA